MSESPLLLFLEPLIQELDFAMYGKTIKIHQIKGLRTYLHIELIDDSDELLKLKYDDIQYDPFILAVILQGLFIREGKIAKAIDVQIKWQNLLDKFDRNPVLDFYLGRFFYNLGLIYYSMDEFEVATNEYSRARKYFLSISFEWGVVAINMAIAKSYVQLGANGDARYHYREIVKTSHFDPLTVQIGLVLANSYLKSGMTKLAISTVENIIPRVDDKELLSLLNQELKTFVE